VLSASLRLAAVEQLLWLSCHTLVVLCSATCRFGCVPALAHPWVGPRGEQLVSCLDGDGVAAGRAVGCAWMCRGNAEPLHSCGTCAAS
jgi:hypothetical protein